MRITNRKLATLLGLFGIVVISWLIYWSENLFVVPCYHATTKPRAILHNSGCWTSAKNEEGTTVSGEHVGFISDAMTPETCVHYCHSNNRTYALIKNGTRCWCKASFEDYVPSELCVLTCPGDVNGHFTCGSELSFNMYYQEGLVTPLSKALILGYMRAGSTFTAEIFSMMPAAFYFFEPFHDYSKPDVSYFRTPEAVKRTSRILKYIFNCEITKIPSYVFYHYKDFSTLATLSKGFKNFVKCDKVYSGNSRSINERTQCLQYLKIACERATIRVVKTIRLDMTSAALLHRLDPEVKTILLVRDPRPRFLSVRQLVTNMNKRQEQDILGCEEQVKNVKISKDLPATSVYMLRYEDLSLNPLKVVHHLYKFIRVLPDPAVVNWVRMMTSSNKNTLGNYVRGTGKVGGQPMDARRNNLKWAKSITNFTVIQEIQKECKNMMREYGYLEVENLNHVRDLLHASTIPVTKPKTKWSFSSANLQVLKN